MTNTNLFSLIRVGLLCSIAGLSLFLSCQKKEAAAPLEVQNKKISQPFFNKNVGAPISGKTGKRWINNLQQKSRTLVPSFIVNSQEFMQIINDTSCVGICLYYLQDGSGQAHLALIGVNNTGNVIRKETVATEAGALSWAQFQEWRKIYKETHPGGVEAHFFGTNAYLHLIQVQQVTQVKATRALNDESQPQLLLSDASLTDPEGYYDESIVCPPVCPVNEDIN